MTNQSNEPGICGIPAFNRDFFHGDETFSIIGKGLIGGKATGLAFYREKIAASFDTSAFPGIVIDVPRLTVLATDVFDAFMQRNNLFEIAGENLPDDRIANAFMRADLPAEILGDLRALISKAHTPLAVRSSSLLEDASDHPFAGVYATKMTPNNQTDPNVRFKKLTEAIKFIYASVFFTEGKEYRKTIKDPDKTEKMAVIIQEIVGHRQDDLFYPSISGVARSYNFYATGHARPEQGYVELALGLGKTIVDGEVAWGYSPGYPKAPPPFNSHGELLKQTQQEFWAVNMGKPPAFDPIKETEYLVKSDIEVAESDDTYKYLVSTFDRESTSFVPGMNIQGPRLINFGPILQYDKIPLNAAIKAMMTLCEKELGSPVEIEFAVTLDPKNCEPAKFGFLQVRPLVVSTEEITISSDEMESPLSLLKSETVLGNALVDTLTDIVYLKPERFDIKATVKMAAELGEINERLTGERRHYLLIGFGRWGTSDQWCGIPVNWAQISGAKVIVEASVPGLVSEMSQGSHFFHNVTSNRVIYFSLSGSWDRVVDWKWLDSQPAVDETEYMRHVKLASPLLIKADGRTGEGVVIRHE